MSSRAPRCVPATTSASSWRGCPVATSTSAPNPGPPCHQCITLPTSPSTRRRWASQAVGRGRKRHRAGRWPRPGIEEVAGDLSRAEAGEGERQVEPVVPRLPHAEDPPAAQLHPRGDHLAAGVDPVVEAVGGADLGEEAPTRLEVVGVTIDAGGGQPLPLTGPAPPPPPRHLRVAPAPAGASHRT